MFNVKVGGKYSILEKTNPHTKTKASLNVVILSLDNKGGFFCYNLLNNRVMHSNIFVWGVESITFKGMSDFEVVDFRGVSWIKTGIDLVDYDMGNLGPQYQLFTTLAPKKLFKKYERQENNNCHRTNGKMVLDFLDFVMKGGNPELFK